MLGQRGLGRLLQPRDVLCVPFVSHGASLPRRPFGVLGE